MQNTDAGKAIDKTIQAGGGMAVSGCKSLLTEMSEKEKKLFRFRAKNLVRIGVSNAAVHPERVLYGGSATLH